MATIPDFDNDKLNQIFHDLNRGAKGLDDFNRDELRLLAAFYMRKMVGKADHREQLAALVFDELKQRESEAATNAALSASQRVAWIAAIATAGQLILALLQYLGSTK